MIKLGSGYEHIVYDYSKDKVIKIKTSKFYKLRKLYIYYPELIFKPHKIRSKYLEYKKVISQSNEIISALEDTYLFGNPIIKDNKLIQDKVKVVENILTRENYKKIIDDYIKLIQELWRLGIHETVYNFSKNNGYNNNKKLIQIDYGEITNHKDEVIKLIKNKKWLQQYTYKRHLNNEMKIYFKKEMNKIMTIKNLNKCWKKN